MTRDLLLKLAASGFVLGFATSGCTANNLSAGVKPVKQTADTGKASKSAEKARAALTKGDASRAISLAEGAVAGDPDNATHRALLAQTYLNNGRFASAETAFTDAMAMGRTEAQVVIGLALSKIALGKPVDAAQLIEANRETLPAADYGLAMALAGDVERAIYALSDAARQPEATARTRQNLAYAYALSGRWVQARIIAAQDLSPAKLDERMAEWAASAQFATSDLRVAGLLGTSVVRDSGMPVRLARAPAAAVQMAAADPVPVAENAPPPPVEPVVAVATADPAPSDLAAVADDMARITLAAAAPLTPTAPAPSVVADAPAPLIVADAAPYKSPVDLAVKAVTVAAAAKDGGLPASAFNLAGPVAYDAKKPRGWAVQLGAYDSLAVAKSKWTMISATIPNLKRFPASSQSATVKGKLYYRLTANGLATRADAMALCQSVKASGQKCFVRQMSPSENVRWASARPARLAAR